MGKKQLVEKYKEIILNSLLENNIIDETLYEKCKPHIQELPYDGNARTEGKLNRRQEAIENKLKEEEDNLKKYENDLKKLEDEEKELKKLEKEKKQFDDNFLKENELMYIEDRIETFEEEYDAMLKEGIDDWLSDLSLAGFNPYW